MADYFTSDTHFNHANIIEYCERPYGDVKVMNQALIDRWNATVGDDDTVFHLGDFGFGNADQLSEIRVKLQGKIILIRGNHDSLSKTAYVERVGFDAVHDELEYGDWLLCHYPSIELSEYVDKFAKKRPKMPLDKWLICGHVHDKWAYLGRQFNVGVDIHDFMPIDVEVIKDSIKAIEEVL